MKKPNISIRKAIISMIFGLLCYYLSTEPFVIYRAYDLTMTVGIILPIIIAFTWGYKYALISYLGGLVWLVPFFLHSRDGWGNIPNVLFLFLWIVGNGYCTDKRHKNEQPFYNLYIFNTILILIYCFANPVLVQKFARLNLNMWPGNYAFSFLPLNIIKVNQYMMMILVIIYTSVIHSITSINICRRAFGEPERKESVNNSTIFIGTLVFAFYMFISDRIGDSYNAAYFGLEVDRFKITIAKTQKVLFMIAIICAAGDFLMHLYEHNKKNTLAEETSRNRYRNILESIMDTYIEFDNSGLILEYSPSTLDVLGYSRSDMASNRNITDFFYDIEKGKEFMENINAEIDLQDREITFRGRNNKEIFLHISSLTRFEDNFILVARDITNLKKSQQDKLKLQANLSAVFEASDDCIWTVTGTDFSILTCNLATRNYFFERCNIDVAKGTRLEDMFDVSDRQMWVEYYSKCLSKGKVKIEFNDTLLNRIYEIRCYIINYGAETGDISIFMKDITETKHIAERMRNLNKELEERVVERTKDIQHAYNELERYSYTVSHEFKAPIRAINSYINFLEEDNADNLNESMLYTINGIRKLCDRTLEMIGRLLEHAKANSKKLNLQILDIKDIILRTCENLKIINTDKDIKLNIYELPKVIGDKFLIEQVIYNILSNSVKFSSKQEKVFIDIGCMMTKTDVSIYFKDNGAGFDMKYADKIFKLFNRMHTTDEFEGSGVGLATVRNIMKKHGGNAYIMSEEENGCVMVIVFPR